MRSTVASWAVVACAGLAVLLMAGPAVAQSTAVTLPAPYVFVQTGDSPGPVTFTHSSHVDESAPACTACHPRVFRILKAGTTADGKTVTHASMSRKQGCGTCHDGQKAFGVDDCTLCHRSR